MSYDFISNGATIRIEGNRYPTFVHRDGDVVRMLTIEPLGAQLLLRITTRPANGSYSGDALSVSIPISAANIDDLIEDIGHVRGEIRQAPQETS